jgi:Uma2 family endonuclease
MMSVDFARFQFSADQFERMVETGILTEDDRVELIDGELVAMSPIGSRHVACVNSLTTLLVLALEQRGIVSVQNPVRLNTRNEPLPDLAVLRPRKARYRDALPTGKDVLIAIEVSDTTAVFDRTTKLPRYAANGVREAWLVDLKARHVEVHSKPRAGQFTKRALFAPGDLVTSTVVRGLVLPVDDILP